MAFTYCISFRIAERTINGKSPAQRRQALIDNVHQENHGYWDETTSFILVESGLQTPDLAKQAVKGLSAEYDTVLIFDPDDMSANYFGKVDRPDVLKSFFPKLAKV